MKNLLVISLLAVSSLFVGCVPDDEGLFDNATEVSGNAGAPSHMTEKEGIEAGILRFDPKTQSACCSYCVTSALGESLRDDSCDWWLCCGPEPVAGELDVVRELRFRHVKIRASCGINIKVMCRFSKPNKLEHYQYAAPRQ